MKYAPKSVFILENGKYIEISYEELCNRAESDDAYKNKRFLPLYGMLMEVEEELSREKGDISFDMLTTDDFNGQDILVDTKTDVYQLVEQKITMDKLQKVYHC